MEKKEIILRVGYNISDEHLERLLFEMQGRSMGQVFLIEKVELKDKEVVQK